ncbi:MAG TPA: ATP-binding protein [Candidatus Thermoplasmatota archaeon]|nr:ATP-binding protein [Candidatus Thermoplasmatota archaeon]
MVTTAVELDDAGRLRRLVQAVQDLSRARDLEGVSAVVRRAARDLTGADGATFILRDDDKCHYVDEDAVAPLWKGRRFPMKACISGWVMLNCQPAVIEDIYADQRIPHEAYRPTFVKSLAMVPIRPHEPLGAIGNYWATQRKPTSAEVELLQALANTAAVALENVRTLQQLEALVQRRTAALLAANQELEAFTRAASHDLRAPLRTINAHLSLLLLREGTSLSPAGRKTLATVQNAAVHMDTLVSAFLKLSAADAPLRPQPFDLAQVARDVVEDLRIRFEGPLEVHVAEDLPMCVVDATLMRQVLENLLSNAVKFSKPGQTARIEVGGAEGSTESVYFVRDQGVGFAAKDAERLFQPFMSLHDRRQYPGHGIGLNLVQRIVQRHGGRVWAEGTPGGGATFYFTVPHAAQDLRDPLAA